MIYFIGGAPRIGKSLIAESLAKMTNAVCVSTDEIDEQYTETLSENERERLFPMPNFSGTPSNNTMKPEERVSLQMIGADSLEQVLEEVISEKLQKNQHVVVEGIHITPSLIDHVKTQHPDQNTRTIFIGSQNKNLIIDGIKKNTNPHNWLKDSPQEIIQQVADFVTAFSSFIQNETVKNTEDYFERTMNFEEDQKHILNLLND